jgi:hypothetical protein
MEAVRSSEKSVNYQIIWSHIPEDSTLQAVYMLTIYKRRGNDCSAEIQSDSFAGPKLITINHAIIYRWKRNLATRYSLQTRTGAYFPNSRRSWKCRDLSCHVDCHIRERGESCRPVSPDGRETNYDIFCNTIISTSINECILQVSF